MFPHRVPCGNNHASPALTTGEDVCRPGKPAHMHSKLSHCNYTGRHSTRTNILYKRCLVCTGPQSFHTFSMTLMMISVMISVMMTECANDSGRAIRKDYWSLGTYDRRGGETCMAGIKTHTIT